MLGQSGFVSRVVKESPQTLVSESAARSLLTMITGKSKALALSPEFHLQRHLTFCFGLFSPGHPDQEESQERNCGLLFNFTLLNKQRNAAANKGHSFASKNIQHRP